MKVYTGTGV